MSTSPVSTPPPRASRCLSIMNIHGARRAGHRRRKACIGYGLEVRRSVRTASGAGALCRHAHSLFFSCFFFTRRVCFCIVCCLFNVFLFYFSGVQYFYFTKVRTLVSSYLFVYLLRAASFDGLLPLTTSCRLSK